MHGYTSLVSNPDPPPRKKGEGRRVGFETNTSLSLSFHLPSLPLSSTLVTFLHCWMLSDYSFKSETITLTSSLKRYDLFRNQKYRINFFLYAPVLIVFLLKAEVLLKAGLCASPIILYVICNDIMHAVVLLAWSRAPLCELYM